MVRGITKKLLMTLLMLGVFCLLKNGVSASAEVISGERAIGGLSYYLDLYYESSGNNDSAALYAEPVAIPENVAIAKVDDYLNIREGAGTGYNVVGFLPKNGMCIVSEVKDGWAKIESGSIKGYVSTDYLYMGEKGYEKAASLTSLKATVKAGKVNFRSTPDTSVSSNVIDQVSAGESLAVIDECVVAKDDNTTLWVKVYLDDMEGYVAKDLVDVAYDWERAVSMKEVIGGESNVGMSAIRASLVMEAKKHIGLRYVWGGNSLKSGCDCSGFCLAVYREVGISTADMPRTSYGMASCSKGKKVSLSEAKPGDLVFYGTSSGSVNHVAMYIGNNQIIHESGHKYGCMISNIDYRHYIKIKNFLD